MGTNNKQKVDSIESKKIEFASVDETGEVEYSFTSTEASGDWLKAGRLAQLAKKGDKKAAKELERMDNEQMYAVDLDAIEEQMRKDGEL